LNAWLLDRCVAYAKANRHPELTDQTIWQVFEAERAKLVPISGRFDGSVRRRPSMRVKLSAAKPSRAKQALSRIRQRLTTRPGED
jgi:hypothetical protein